MVETAALLTYPLGMKTGMKAQGQDHRAKLFVQRHGHAKPRSYNRCEKAIETKVRHGARKEIRAQLYSV